MLLPRPIGLTPVPSQRVSCQQILACSLFNVRLVLLYKCATTVSYPGINCRTHMCVCVLMSSGVKWHDRDGIKRTEIYVTHALVGSLNILFLA